MKMTKSCHFLLPKQKDTSSVALAQSFEKAAFGVPATKTLCMQHHLETDKIKWRETNNLTKKQGNDDICETRTQKHTIGQSRIMTVIIVTNFSKKRFVPTDNVEMKKLSGFQKGQVCSLIVQKTPFDI